MINFAALEENIVQCKKQQEEMSAQLNRLETTVSMLATKAEVDTMEARLKEQLSLASRALERLDVAQKAASQVVQEMPSIQRELTGRMSELEQRLTGEASNMLQLIGGRLATAEGELRNKASKTDLHKVKTELEDCVRREHVDKMQALVNKVRDEASDRIDGIAERTFNMRKELDAKQDQMSAMNELNQKRVDERTVALEEQADEVSTFLAKAERQIGGKVANDELNRVTKAFAEQLQETRNVLQAQMDVVRARAERSTEDFQRVVGKMDAVAMRTEVLPISEDVKQLQAALIDLNGEVRLKAFEDDVAAKLDDILATQGQHTAQLATKADAAEATARHQHHVIESTHALNGLREVTEHLGISINSVEESVNLVASQTGAKADTRDVHEVMTMNEAVQAQVSALKGELQGTLKALETWILEQNTKKTHGMKLQPKPTEGGASTAAKPRSDGVSAAAPLRREADVVGDEKLLARVVELERQLAETQALFYAQAAGGGGRLHAGGANPFGAAEFVPPSGVPPVYAYGNGNKLDASGAFQLPGASGEVAPSPRPPLPQRKAPGVMGATAAHTTSTALKGSYAGGALAEAEQPPFRSQSDRRQWLLQEKRRWLVEMRLSGGTPTDATGGGVKASRLPPLGPSGDALSTPGAGTA